MAPSPETPADLASSILVGDAAKISPLLGSAPPRGRALADHLRRCSMMLSMVGLKRAFIASGLILSIPCASPSPHTTHPGEESSQARRDPRAFLVVLLNPGYAAYGNSSSLARSLSLSPSRSCSLSFLLSLTPSHIPVGFKGTPEAVSIWEDRMNDWVAFTTSPSQENALSPLCHFRSWFAHVPVPRCWPGRVWMWSRLVPLRSACNRAERGSSP